MANTNDDSPPIPKNHRPNHSRHAKGRTGGLHPRHSQNAPGNRAGRLPGPADRNLRKHHAPYNPTKDSGTSQQRRIHPKTQIPQGPTGTHRKLGHSPGRVSQSGLRRLV